jgi:ribosomal protein S18 acetylase RimI-like enzyme
MRKKRITRCTRKDFDDITGSLDEFWDVPPPKHLHNPRRLLAPGKFAVVIKDRSRVVAYMFGRTSQSEPTVGYVSLVAVRRSHRRKHLGKTLYEYFVEWARSRGCKLLKAITTPDNANSIAFHKKIGMTAKLVKNYAGRGENKDRLVLKKKI